MMEKENSTAFYSHPMGFEFASLSLSLSLSHLDSETRFPFLFITLARKCCVRDVFSLGLSDRGKKGRAMNVKERKN